MSSGRKRDSDPSAQESRLTLQSTGVTLVGVLLSIGMTVGFGVAGAWWIRVIAGVATTAGLILVVWFFGTRTALLARLADWITGRTYDVER